MLRRILAERSAEECYQEVFRLLEGHHRWFEQSLPLIASENVQSKAVKEAIATDLGSRYAEGWPGHRVYAGCKYIDEIELIGIELAKRLFKAEFADIRPISGVCSNLSIYSAFTAPNDRMITLAIPNGGHISHGRRDFSGTAGLVHGLRIEYFPFDHDLMNIDVDKTIISVRKMIEEKDPPELAMFGGSLFLFPHPVRELADFLHSNGIFICYDSAHVSGLIAGGQFQDPLREGVDALTLSTHKTLFGPQGGAIVSFEKYSEDIKKAVFPGNTSNHHLHHIAGKAVAFAEMLRFGHEYAAQVVKNAKTLAQKLCEKGFHVLGEKKGFTESHQVVVDVTKYGDGGIIENELERCNIIVNRQLIPGDVKAGRHYMHPGGLRLGTSEITRLGMKQDEVEQIADLMKCLIIDHELVEKLRNRVIELRRSFTKMHYVFDSEEDAYKYMRIRQL